MRPRLLLSLITILVVMPLSLGAQTSLQCVKLTYDLTLESTDRTTNGEVSKLQRFLSQFPDFYPEKKVNGFYGISTQLAVQRFQTRYGIAPPSIAEGWGSVRQSTRERMADCSSLLQAPRPTPQNPATPKPPARPVAPVPPRAPTPPTVATPVTYERSFEGCPAFSRDLKRGDSGQSVADLQFFLRDRGHFDNDVTGFFGAVTEGAVQNYQRAANIVSSGSPATTGFGAVGPRTRALIARCQETEEHVEEPEYRESEEHQTQEEEELEQSEENYEEEFGVDDEEETYLSCETSVSPESITAGDDATLSWTTKNAVNAAWIGIGKVDLNGSVVVRPNEPAEFTLRITGSDGAVEECVIYVDVVEVAEPEITLSAEPEDIVKGKSSTISWGAENVASCSLTGPGVAVEKTSGSVSTGPLTKDTTYTLTCKSRAGERVETVTVYVYDSLTSRAFGTAYGLAASAAAAYFSWFEALLALLP